MSRRERKSWRDDSMATNVSYELEVLVANVTTNTTSTFPYDYHGAMLFTVITILVYGMSIVAFIAGHVRRKHITKEEQAQITKYLKRADDIRRQGVKEDVLRLRSQLFAESVIANSSMQERRKSRVERARNFVSEIKCVQSESEDSSSSSSNSCILLPACTIATPRYSDHEEESKDKSSADSLENREPSEELASISIDTSSLSETRAEENEDEHSANEDMNINERQRPNNDEIVENNVKHNSENTPPDSPEMEAIRQPQRTRRVGILEPPTIISEHCDDSDKDTEEMTIKRERSLRNSFRRGRKCSISGNVNVLNHTDNFPIQSRRRKSIVFNIPLISKDDSIESQEEGKAFIESRGGGSPRNSLHQSLKHSVLTDISKSCVANEENLPSSQHRRDRRRGGLLSVPLLQSQPSQD